MQNDTRCSFCQTMIRAGMATTRQAGMRKHATCPRPGPEREAAIAADKAAAEARSLAITPAELAHMAFD